nr:hypothetical protein [Tanacetum cinerariifolium]
LGDGIDQTDFGVACQSSSSGFHQSCRKFTLGIWAFPMSLSLDKCTCASEAISSSIWRSLGVDETDVLSLIGRGGGGGTCDDPKALGDPKVPYGPTGGEGGGG